MSAMGAHTALSNGRRGEDGSAGSPVIMPLVIPDIWPPARGPVQDIPRAGPAPGGRPEPGVPQRISADRIRRGSMWALAAGVAVIAAIQSYSHIYDLGRAHGGTGVPARLLPLSVDMLILVGELMLLHEADKKGRRFALGWVLVWSGILATLAANVTYGYQFGVLGAVIWGWPAYSFILAAGGMVAVVKRGAARDAGAGTEPGSESDTPDIPGPASAIPPASARADKTPDKTLDKRADKPQARTVTGADRAAAILRREPGLSNAEVARRARVSAKTVQRARNAPPGTSR